MAVAESDDIWRPLYQAAFERFSLPSPPPTGTWREAYQIKQRVEMAWRRGIGRCEWLLGHTGPVMCLEPVAATYMASGSGDGSVRLWDLGTAMSGDGGGKVSSFACLPSFVNLTFDLPVSASPHSTTLTAEEECFA